MEEASLTRRSGWALFVAILLLSGIVGCGGGSFPPTAPSPIPTATPTQPSTAKLQLHYIDVGQGDAAIVVSPGGESVMFDDGVSSGCGKVTSYLRQLGLTRIDYHIASHYHADHIGCAQAVFSAFPLSRVAFDRGGSYSTATFTNYLTAIGGFRQTATVGSSITLDAGSATPVRIDIVALNGNGVSTDDENALSIVSVVHYGTFDAEFGGDLSGSWDSGGADVESSVAGRVGRIEVYKVHHHGSTFSSNSTWLSATNPKVGIISVGNGNTYGHPTADAVGRLHSAGVRTYWTEYGAGAAPGGMDVVGGDIRIDVDAAAGSFTVAHGGASESYATWEGRSMTAPTDIQGRSTWSPRSGDGAPEAWPTPPHDLRPIRHVERKK